jgi:hypothetical protein
MEENGFILVQSDPLVGRNPEPGRSFLFEVKAFYRRINKLFLLSPAHPKAVFNGRALRS